MEDLCTKQEEIEVEVRGPPVSKAFDDQGNPTKVTFVLTGFHFCSSNSLCDAWIRIDLRPQNSDHVVLFPLLILAELWLIYKIDMLKLATLCIYVSIVLHVTVIWFFFNVCINHEVISPAI